MGTCGAMEGGLLSAIYSVDIYLLENFQIGVTGMGPAGYSTTPSHYILFLSSFLLNNSIFRFISILFLLEKQYVGGVKRTES